MTMRKIAAHRLETPTGVIHLGVVVIREGIVEDCFPFSGEMPFTEWLGGTIVVRPDDNGMLRAFQDGVMLE